MTDNHPFLAVANLTVARLEGALRLITENPNGDKALEGLADAIRAELAKRRK